MKNSKVVSHIISWLTDYSNKSSTNGFVIGVSGGIDSAVTSTLAALTKKNVFLINMPIHQDRHQFLRAENHITWIKKKSPNVESINQDLSSVFDAFCKDLPKNIQDELTMANLRARIRMSTLYAFASHNKSLVVGTGNKVEDFGVGFYTKYGDGGVDISPIADLTKTEVFELAKYLDIIEEIQKAAPTDGLWGEDRTDEEQLGATYLELEWAMKYIENKSLYGLDERQKEVLLIYKKLNSTNKHKMLNIPVCKIPLAFKI